MTDISHEQLAPAEPVIEFVPDERAGDEMRYLIPVSHVAFQNREKLASLPVIEW